MIRTVSKADDGVIEASPGYRVDAETGSGSRGGLAGPAAERRVCGSANLTSTPYWILVESEKPLKVLTLEADDGSQTLPVFSSHEEAGSFASEAWLVARATSVREVGGGKLISLLLGPLWAVSHIALDPLGDFYPGALELVCIGRGIFLDKLMGRGRSWLETSIELSWVGA